MHDVAVSTRINGELAEQMEQLASALGRKPSWLLRQALESYVASERQFLEAVRQGVDAYRQGQTVAHEDVAADLHRRRQARSS